MNLLGHLGLRRRLGGTILAAFFLLAGAATGVACICDEICHPGEIYSDEAEMCVPKDQATS